MIFAKLVKVNEEQRTVYGRAVQGDVVDKSGEVFDYGTSKPHFQRWSADASAATGGKSLGNVRSMHSNVAAGKLTDIQFDDHDRAIDVAARIVDDGEWKKVLSGVYTGFSIGGTYLKKWPDSVDGQLVTRYTAKPTEISLVDAPCVPTARFFDIQKRDGSIRRVAFQNPGDINMFTPRDENFCGRSTAAAIIKAALSNPSGDLADLSFTKGTTPSRGETRLMQRISKRLEKELAKHGLGIKGPTSVGFNGAEGGSIAAIREIHSGGARKMSPVSLPPQSDNSAKAPTRIHPHIQPEHAEFKTPKYSPPPLFGASPQSASESNPSLPPGSSGQLDPTMAAIKQIHRQGPQRGYLR